MRPFIAAHKVPNTEQIMANRRANNVSYLSRMPQSASTNRSNSADSRGGRNNDKMSPNKTQQSYMQATASRLLKTKNSSIMPATSEMRLMKK